MANADIPLVRRRRSIAALARWLAALPTVLVLSVSLTLAQEPEDADGRQLGPVFMLSLGGKLYDDLWPILELPPPGERNPAFADLSASDHDTWRCVSCHGWDYRGARGERAGVAPNANAASLAHLREADPQIIVEKIIAPSHPFVSEALPDLALFLLAAFVSEGQYDRDSLLNENGRARGDPEAGQAIFEGACIACHELDGRTFLRGETRGRSLGGSARNHPERTLHKIINGVPATEMLSLRFLPDEAIADLLAYLQTLDDR